MANRTVDLPLSQEVSIRLVEPGNFHRTASGTRIFTYTGRPYWEANIRSGPVHYLDTAGEQRPAPTLSVGDNVRFPVNNKPFTRASESVASTSLAVDDFVRIGGKLYRVIDSSGRLSPDDGTSASGTVTKLNALVGAITSFPTGNMRPTIRGPYNFVVEID